MNQLDMERFRASGMTIGELAALTGVSFPTAWRWTQGYAAQPKNLALLVELGLAQSSSSIKDLSPTHFNLVQRLAAMTLERDAALEEVRRLREILGRTSETFDCGGALDQTGRTP